MLFVHKFSLNVILGFGWRSDNTVLNTNRIKRRVRYVQQHSMLNTERARVSVCSSVSNLAENKRGTSSTRPSGFNLAAWLFFHFLMLVVFVLPGLDSRLSVSLVNSHRNMQQTETLVVSTWIKQTSLLVQRLRRCCLAKVKSIHHKCYGETKWKFPHCVNN